ncbi:MAG: endonuclease/exonuclease/phosphatase family protein [Promethearchaeota archaeon]
MQITWFANDVLSWLERIYQFLFPIGWDTWQYPPLFWLFAVVVYIVVIILKNKLSFDKEAAAKAAINAATKSPTEAVNEPTESLIKGLISDLLPGLLLGFWLSPILLWISLRLLLKALVNYREIHRKISTIGKIVGISCFTLVGLVIAVVAGLSTWLWTRYSWMMGTPFLVGLGLIGIEIALRLVLRIKQFPFLKDISPFKTLASGKSKKLMGTFLLIFIMLTSAFFMGFFLPPRRNPAGDQIGLPSVDLTVMSYNIKNAGDYSLDRGDFWDNRRDDMAAYITTLDVDIFGVQEAYLPQITYLKQSITNRQYRFFGVGRKDGVHGGEHSAIFYDSERFVLMEGDDFWLSDTPRIPSKQWDDRNYRICTWARFREIITDREFYIFNTHLSTQNVTEAGNVHLMTVALIYEHILTFSGDLPILLMGDFNFENTSLAYGELLSYTEKPMYDTYVLANEGTSGGVPWDYSTNSFDSTTIPNKSRIDFIFASGGISVDQCWIPKDVYDGTRPYSDHYPVLLTATLI